MDDIATLISTLGFPICCCVALFRQMNENQKMNNEKMDALTEDLNEIKRVIEQLRGKLD